MGDPLGIQFKLIFMAVFVLMLNYNSESGIAVTNLGAPWEDNDGTVPIWC